jgi:hypothetical protein
VSGSTTYILNHARPSHRVFRTGRTGKVPKLMKDFLNGWRRALRENRSTHSTHMHDLAKLYSEQGRLVGALKFEEELSEKSQMIQ